MAKVKLACMSIEAHGKFAGCLCFSTNRWGQYVRIIAPKRYTNTDAQKKVRHAYGQVAQLWRSRTLAQRAVYHPQAVKQRLTNYNIFFKATWPDFYVLENSTTLSRAVLNKNYLGFVGL